MSHIGQLEAHPLGDFDSTAVVFDSVFVFWHDKVSSVVFDFYLITNCFEQFIIRGLISSFTNEQYIDFLLSWGRREAPYQLEIQSFNKKQIFRNMGEKLMLIIICKGHVSGRTCNIYSMGFENFCSVHSQC